MTAFHEFLTQLLDQGKIVFRSATAPHDRASARGVAILAEAFETTGLSVAGPRITFDPSSRLRGGRARPAGELGPGLPRRTRGRSGEATEDAWLAGRLRRTTSPADLMLRYLPQILRRARGLDPSDPLVELLANILRRWPLSGVLSDVDEGSAGSLGLWRALRALALVCRAFDRQRSAILAARAARENLGLL